MVKNFDHPKKPITKAFEGTAAGVYDFRRLKTGLCGGALGKGPPRARLLPEPLRITGASLRLEELDFRIKKNRGERVECLHFDYFFDLHPYGDANRLWSCSSFHLDLIKLV